MDISIKVLVLGLRGFPDVQGGVERHAEQLYPLLAQAGCRVEVIARSPYVSPERNSWNGVVIRRLWAPRIRGLEAFIHSVFGVIYAGIRRPDILHIHAIGPAIVVPMAKIFGLNVVVTHHGPDYEREKWGRFARSLLKLGEKWGMKYADRRIVISNVIRQLILEKYRLDSIVIPNGVTPHEIPDTRDSLEKFSLVAKRYVLLVSRFVPEKRHLDLIEAFGKAGLPDWRLVLVGEVDARDTYCQRVLASAAQNLDIVITGFQSGKSLQELYAHAGIFVLPSSHEGLPIALLEALSYGLPVLASNISANMEVGLPEQNYFPLGDIAALSKALRHQAVEQPDGEQRFKLRTWIGERYHWNSVAQHTLEVYKEVMLNSPV